MGLGKPMSLWKMQETSGTTVSDFIGANIGTATSGNARRFNGTNDGVSFNNPIVPVGAKTIKFKFRRNGSPSANGYVMDNAGYPYYYGFSVLLDTSGKLSFMVYNGTSINLSTPTSVCDNKWHEIMFTWDGTTNPNMAKLFVDDMVNPVATKTANATEIAASINNFRIGSNATNAQFAGFDIDDLQITNGYMGAGTVVAWWKMDDSAAYTMVDSSSNAWTPSITGTTVITDTNIPIVSDGAGGYCRRFNGRSDRITFTSQVLPLGAKSIKFDIRIPSAPTSAQTILSNAEGSTENGTWIGVTATGAIQLISYQGNSSSTRFNITTKKTIADNQWHTVLLNWDGTTNINGVKVFIDDMVNPDSQATAASTETTAATRNLMIGANNTLVQFFQGDLKNIQINVGSGNEQTNPSKMQIGDFIAASYTAASGAFGSFSGLGISPTSFIPPASSATPNGGFYLIYVGDDFLGRKILVADRNVQQNISWDTLNTAGVASGSGLPTNFHKITNECINGSSIRSSDKSSSFPISNAFDGDTSTYWYGGESYPSGVSYIGYDFINPKTISFIYLFQHTSAAYAVTSVKIQVSNDNITWNTLTTVSVLPGANNIFFNNNTPYRYWRILANSNTSTSGNSWGVAEVSMYEGQNFANMNFTTRLLTGGTSSSDTDNEWDNFIVKSSLGGTITPGDNNVWNWSNIWSWTSTVTNSVFREVRGNSAVGNYSTYNTSATSNAFRPVILVEILTSKKYLFQDGNDIKKYVPASTPSGTLCTGGTAIGGGSTDGSTPDLAFDASTSTSYNPKDSLGAWVGYQFTSPVTLTSASITANMGSYGSYFHTALDYYDNVSASWKQAGITYNSNAPGNSTSLTQTITATVTASSTQWRIRIVTSSNNGTHILYDAKMYGSISSGWNTVGQAPATQAMFDTNGMTDLSIIDKNAIAALVSNQPKLLAWTNGPAFTSGYMTAVPNGQLIFQDGDIDVTRMKTLTISGSNIKMIVSADKGITWKTFDGTKWNTISADAATVKIKGMSISDVNGLTTDQWNALLNNSTKLRFAYYLEQTSSSDVVNVNKIDISYLPTATVTPTLDSIKVSYEELTIEGRMQDLEQVNAINMAKLEFKSNSLMLSNKYELHDMVIDTFESSDTVETNTTSAVYDAVHKQFVYDTSASAPLIQEVNFPVEALPSYRHKFILNVDHEGNIQYQYSLDAGTNWFDISPFMIIDLTGKSGTNLKIKVKLLDSTAKLKGIAFLWA